VDGYSGAPFEGDLTSLSRRVEGVFGVVMFAVASIFLSWTPDWVNQWFNYPGLEVWKFANLLIFIVCALYLHRRFGRPIREALRARSEAIKEELEKSRQDRDEALTKLAEVEARFANLDAELTKIAERARIEADAEKRRIEASTDLEIGKIRSQAKRDIESAGKAARHELRRFAAIESVRLAEELLKREMRPEDDARLMDANVHQLERTRA
jgi:F-type H+-transporting ATPase subunit b